MSTLTWAAQVAAVQRWESYAPLAAIVGARIFDGEAPRDADGKLPKAPYIVVGDKTGTPRKVFGGAGGRAVVTAHVWSAYPGSKEAEAIIGHMMDALAEKITPTGFVPARLRWEYHTVFVDPPTKMRHAPVRFRISTMESQA